MMFYTSKRRSFKKFLQNKNLKYYAAFLMVFLVLISVIIFINKNNLNNTSNSNTQKEQETTSTKEGDTVVAAKGSYYLRLNLSNGQLSIHEYDSKNGTYSSTPVKYMLAAYSNSLKEGIYAADSTLTLKSSWLNNGDNTFYRFNSKFTDTISFHSALYSKNTDKNSLIVEDYNTIGNSVDTSGITLTLADAKWIYENCSFESKIECYTNADEDVSADTLIAIPSGITWDPTDDATGSPWCQTHIDSLSVIKGTLTLPAGSSLTALTSNVTATDESGASVVAHVYITGTYDLNKAGKYYITYNLTDIYGSHEEKTITLQITEAETTAAETTTINSTTESTSLNPTIEPTTTVDNTETTTQPSATTTPTEPLETTTPTTAETTTIPEQ